LASDEIAADGTIEIGGQPSGGAGFVAVSFGSALIMELAVTIARPVSGVQASPARHPGFHANVPPPSRTTINLIHKDGENSL
jgi:hypothetical protein